MFPNCFQPIGELTARGQPPHSSTTNRSIADRLGPPGFKQWTCVSPFSQCRSRNAYNILGSPFSQLCKKLSNEGQRRSRQCLPALPCALYRLWIRVREAFLCTPRAHCCWLFLILILPCALGVEVLSSESLVARCAKRVSRHDLSTTALWNRRAVRADRDQTNDWTKNWSKSGVFP